MDMLVVFLGLTRENQDIVQVDEGAMVNEVPKDIIHQGLEYCLVLVRPKVITSYSKHPRDVLNAVFYSSPFQILTRW